MPPYRKHRAEIRKDRIGEHLERDDTPETIQMTSTLAQTPLHQWHIAHKGRMVDFAGWSMPVQYTSIVAEHNATRTAAGVFDISHMGRLRFEGPDAASFLDAIVTRRVADLEPGKIRYGLITNEEGGILDDVLVYHVADVVDAPFQMVVNAGNREKILDWLGAHKGSSDVDIIDRTASTVMFAVQGPRALQIIQPLTDIDLAAMKYYTGQFARIATGFGLISRTGYTGEDGCEVIVDAQAGEGLWPQVIDACEAVGGLPAGLGCRDTLRLEAAMPLYGHELSEQVNPFQAGLGFAVNLKDRQFIGKDAMIRWKAQVNQPRRVGLELSGRRVPRQHHPILASGRTVGEVTSGTFSPTFAKPIAMGYVQPDYAAAGNELGIDIRGRKETARVIKLPFYTRGA